MIHSNLAPIVLFVYNRPQHTELTLNAIRNADFSGNSRLIIFSDGPKLNASDSECNQINSVRRIIREQRWCGSVEIVERSVNYGLAKSVILGVTEVVEKYGKIIVLEDDILVSKGFIKYLNEALVLYHGDDKVMHISASNYNIDTEGLGDTFFARTLTCHGWGTWARSWKHFSNDAIDHLAYFQPGTSRARDFDVDGSAYFLNQLIKNINGSIKTWAVLWYASWLRVGGLSLIPRRSLITNIGFDKFATHTMDSKSNYLMSPTDFVDVIQIPVLENELARKKIANFWKNYLGELSREKRRRLRFSFFFYAFIARIRGVFRWLLYLAVPELKLLFTTSKTTLITSKLKDSSIGENVKLNEPFHISYSTIANYSYVSKNSNISYTEVGKFCSIGPNVICGWGVHPLHGVSTSPLFYSTLGQVNGEKWIDSDSVQERKKITIGNDVFIGMNVVILDGVTIGDGSVVGAGCIVSKDVPPYAIVVGNPMRIVRYRFEVPKVEKLIFSRWWDLPVDDLKLLVSHQFDND
jgi:acetyltransferase-like isoleucine patch superfamily enzyme/GT2 family glycosyltransferase